ncbi:MAG TPA: beta-L-arabinofuranosidase domain-containing protein [Pyrinomonadaceae bacterium]|nr:beta-L-arabinofuranosidase domain-containing protein [Pyrinomonadaceae bacterium]
MKKFFSQRRKGAKVILSFLSFLCVFAPLREISSAQVPDRIHREAQEFPLEDVRLLDGPFKDAMMRDAAYLLRLDPDRLLSGFRKEAGLTPKAAAYGGWESMTIAGHSLGHYLSACALMFASTGDVRFRQRVNYIIDELDACQRANGNGYVAAIPNGKKIFQEISAGDIRVQPFDLNGGWVPWYTLHKLFAGLLDTHRYLQNTKALDVAVKLADWANATVANLNEEQFQHMLGCEHGGMNEVLAELYARTGNEKYLRLSRRFHHKAVLEPLARREDRLQGLHANTQIPKLIGLARRYELTGDVADKTAAEFFWDRVVHHHSYVNGGNSDNERFGAPDKLSNRLSDNMSETCNTYNMLKLTRHLFEWHGSAEYADYYERALYNHILASQDPNDGMVCYYVPLKANSQKAYSKPFDSFWCCVGTGMENHAKYGEAIYFHNDDSLWVNLFIPSELNWREKRVSLRQETRYPESEKVSFTVKAQKPVSFALRLRYPGWAKSVGLTVNGRPQTVDAKPGSFIELKRRWKNGDRVELTLPMSLRLEPMADNPQRVAVLYGPTVLAGDLGAEQQSWSVSLMPALVADGAEPSKWMKPVAGTPVTFRTASVGRPADLTLYPFYRMHHKRYAVYWDLLNEQQWNEREASYNKELERMRRLEAATIDFVQPNDPQLERDHNMQGERTEAGDNAGRNWRHARDGGWLSFDLKVLPEQPIALVCSYWGSETGPRNFDILVDGKKIAAQSLHNDKPGEFFDVTYAIPPELTRGKNKITIRFQAQPGNFAGGFYGVRTIKHE